jgi:hypothetical protein
VSDSLRGTSDDAGREGTAARAERGDPDEPELGVLVPELGWLAAVTRARRAADDPRGGNVEQNARHDSSSIQNSTRTCPARPINALQGLSGQRVTP